MKLFLERAYKGPKYTIGHLYIDGRYFCDTIEDVDRGLNEAMPLQQIQKIKVYGETAIPIGTYRIDMTVVSNKFKNKSWARCCEGRIPRLLGVKGFDGVLIHVGNTEEDSLGCILVGENKIKGKVINSTATFEKLVKVLRSAHSKEETIDLQII